MSRYLDWLRNWAVLHPRAKWFVLPLAILAVVSTVFGSSSPPATPVVTLAAAPLYALGARAKPTLTLALSVEFPTVGAQYLSTPGASSDNTYAASTQYLGYFDSESCYVYNNNPTEGAVADYRRFDRYKAATAHTCGGDSFSGNFMNWASSSAIDILRYGLTGGDRVVDTSSLTILQRAVLPNANVSSNFWNGSNFPDKQIDSTSAANVLPTALLGSYSGTVHIANCLNRIHFGTAATGNCANPGANSSLGVAQATAGAGPVTSYSGTLPSNFTVCASENGTCSFSGVMQVAYGAGSSWYFMSAANGTACGNGVFGDPAYGVGKSCYIRPDPTGWTPPGGTGSLSSDNFFYTRVSVCASDSSGNLLDPRPTLCLRYPSGQYKPTGNLQKYSDRVRVAAFGYLNDSTGDPNERYGGVLRAPMKYVGPTYYDANFSLMSGNNPNQEWDSNTGVFVANPDGNSTVQSGPSGTGPYLSGVTNYLNQFGRTGTFGQYKTYDPVGELYYESLRYIQGLPITPQAVSGMTSAMQDGYPVATTWTDPHPSVAGTSSYSCVRNNIFAIGDVNTHNDKSFPGNTTRLNNESATGIGFPSGRPANPSGNEPDFYFWTKVVGGFESNNAVSYVDGAGQNQTTYNFNPPNSARWGMENQDIGADGAAYFIAGAAYWANTHDIRGTGWTTNWPTAADPRRPGMRVSTYILDVNENAAQNNAGTRHNNQFFLASKYGGFNDVTGTGTPFKAVDFSNTNANWQDPANPGEARNYYLSSSASAVLAALNQIFANIAAQANSIAGSAVSTQQLTSAVPGFVYKAQFDPQGWSGDLGAFSVTVDTNNNVGLSNTPTWQAKVELDAKSASTSLGGDARDIVIGKTAATSVAAATDFRWTALDTDAKAALLAPPYAAASAPPDPDATGQARLNYLRGDRSNEAPNGLLMRTRTSTLGDIVNSPVAYSGAPSRDISDSAYAAFYAANSGRKHALFVGANDGMLHAFDPDHGSVSGSNHLGGDELFAYIPSWMIPKLGALTSPSYVHQSYVDGTPSVAEAKVGASFATATWKTVLVGGTGGGGQGVFALDVTDPAAFNASKVMWEFTDRDDADMGNVIGRPQILKLRTSASTASTVDYQYFAVVASGVDNYANDGNFSTTGNPVIFLLDLSKPTGTAWSLGTNYYKITMAPVGGALTTIASGMAGFSARYDAAGAVSTLYAGDLQGNLWKLDFSLATAGKSSWNLDTLSYYKNGSNPVPMYVALSAAGARQPITMEPTLLLGPSRTTIVAFGTGKFLEVSDNSTSGAPQQSVYELLDNGSNTLDATTSAIADRGRLMAGTASASGGTITVPAFSWGRAASTNDPTGIRSGWFFDFPSAGERQISNFITVAGFLNLGSVIPSVNSCDSGSGNAYSIAVLSGNGTVSQSNVGMLGQPILLQVGNSTVGNADTTGLRAQQSTIQSILIGSSGQTTSTSKQYTSYAGRLSWRELSNYQQLRHSP